MSEQELFERLKPTLRAYLVANSKGTEDGTIRSDSHRQICEELAKFVFGENVKVYRVETDIHKITEAVTDHLDTSVGLPLDRDISDYRPLVTGFFQELLKLIPKIKNLNTK